MRKVINVGFSLSDRLCTLISHVYAYRSCLLSVVMSGLRHLATVQRPYVKLWALHKSKPTDVLRCFSSSVHRTTHQRAFHVHPRTVTCCASPNFRESILSTPYRHCSTRPEPDLSSEADKKADEVEYHTIIRDGEEKPAGPTDSHEFQVCDA
jgi:hypothetical protein